MPPTGAERPAAGADPDAPRTYDEVRAARKAARAARKAAKPKGIDLPFRKAMPAPLLVVFALVAALTLALVAVVLVKPPSPRIGIAERRSPPGETVSHDAGAIGLAPVPEDATPQPVAGCPALSGILVEGGPPAQARLGGVFERVCPHAAGDTIAARSVRALDGVRIRFGVFARTGDTSTLSLAPPERVLINVVFARRDVNALWIAPLLAHEGVHRLYRDRPPSAGIEYEARQAELEMCRLVVDVRSWPRGCTDAQRLLQFERGRAIDLLVRAGFPRREDS